MIFRSVDDLALAGGVQGLDQKAAAQAIREEWLSILEARLNLLLAEPKPEPRHLTVLKSEIRTLRRLLGLGPSPRVRERRRKLMRERVRQYRERLKAS